MHLCPDRKTQLAQLLQFLARGEALARDAAHAQAGIAPEPGMRRFLLAQARQETFHARLFGGAVATLAPCGLRHAPGLAYMERFHTEIEGAIARGEFAESLLALQVILEDLGGAILAALDEGMDRYGWGLAPLRRLVLRQEQGHHEFGLSHLRRLIADGEASPASLRARGEQWIVLCEAMLDETGALFLFFDEDPAAYAARVRRTVQALTDRTTLTDPPFGKGG